MKARFAKDRAATLRFTPVDGPYTLSPAPTVTLTAADGSVIQASASATPSTINTTLDGAVTKDAGTVTVDDATSISRGKQFWLIDPPELVTCRDLDTLTVTLERPTRYAHDDGTAVTGAEVTYALTTTHTDTLYRNARAEWAYTGQDGATVATQNFDVVGHVFRVPLTFADLEDELPAELLRVRGVTYETMLRKAEERLYDDCQARGRRIDEVRSPDQFKAAAVGAIRAWLLGRDRDKDETALERWRTAEGIYEQDFERAISRVEWLDFDEDGVLDGTDDGGSTVDTEDGFSELDVASPQYAVIG